MLMGTQYCLAACSKVIRHFRFRVALVMILGGLFALPVFAQQPLPMPDGEQKTVKQKDGEVSQLSPVVVTATRTPEHAFDLPVSIDVVTIGNVEDDTPQIDAAEYLRSVPGVRAITRQGYYQSTQISIRGAGARAAFGERGIRVYVDGIPATMPDGQGQVSNFSFGGADRIEVLRGPFSALYGNSAGGVIQIFTADGTDPSELSAGVVAGSYGTWQAGAGARGMSAGGGVGYNVHVSGFRTQGYQDLSKIRRINGNGKLDFKVGDTGKLTLLANTVSFPHPHSGGGLTKDQLREDRRQASRSAHMFYSERGGIHQAQVGAVYTQELSDHQGLHALVYQGRRRTTAILGIPVAAQSNPLSSGGANALDNGYRGVDVRWSWKGSLADRPLDFSIGAAYDLLNERRKGYENFAGETLGEFGRLRRNELNKIDNIDEYAQGAWQFADQWSLTLGARHSKVQLKTTDYYITDKNPDDSGRVSYVSTNPVVGVMFRATQRWHLYASYGKGFETPTSIESAYRSDGNSGRNFDLQPARSQNYELGSKWRFDNGNIVDVALFDTHTRNEIAVQSSLGGRTVYQNSGRSQRRGGEVGLQMPLGGLWRLNAAYTYLDATFQTAFGDCDGPDGCQVSKGARMPGIPQQWLDTELRWGGNTGWHAGLRFEASSNVLVDDAGTLAAPGYAVADINAGYAFNSERFEVVPFVRVDNLFDRSYVNRVHINQRAGAYYEPALDRTLWIGVNMTLRH